MDDSDTFYLRRAVALAEEHSANGLNGPFGAVITRGGKMVGEGWNQVISAGDPTAHAEIVAIRRACSLLQTWDLSGCVIHSSCEPCPMCLSAIYWARLDRIVFASSRHEAAGAGFQDAFLYEELGREMNLRRIPCRRIGLPEARTLFDSWAANPDRVPY